MKKRTFWQIQESKFIYRKHAARFKRMGKPKHREKRMAVYTSLMKLAIKTAEGC